jgi:hypothetical protein
VGSCHHGVGRPHVANGGTAYDMLVPVTTAWGVLMLRMEERPTICRVAANVFNEQSRTSDKGWSYRLGVGRDASVMSMF